MLTFLCESQPDDDGEPNDGGFAVDIDMSILDDALAAVERREAQAIVESELGDAEPVDLAELANVEAELALEIEFEDDEDDADDDPLGLDSGATAAADVRIRAMEAESERDQLRSQMNNLSRHKSEIEAKVQRLEDRASRAKASRFGALRDHPSARMCCLFTHGVPQCSQRAQERLQSRGLHVGAAERTLHEPKGDPRPVPPSPDEAFHTP